MEIYVAGSSHPEQIPRVRAAIAIAVAAGYTIAHDWTDLVEEHEHGAEDTRSRDARAVNAIADIGAAWHSPVVLFLIPPDGIHTKGMWAELGTALAARSFGMYEHQGLMIASWEKEIPTIPHIFTTPTDVEATDGELARILVEHAAKYGH